MARIYTFDAQWSILPNADATQNSIKTSQFSSADSPQFTQATTGALAGRQRGTGDYAPLTGLNPQLANLDIITSRGASTYRESGFGLGPYQGFFQNVWKDTDTTTTIRNMRDDTIKTIALAGCSERPKLIVGSQVYAAALDDLDDPDNATKAAAQVTGAPWAQPRSQVVVDGFNPAANDFFGSKVINATNCSEIWSRHTGGPTSPSATAAPGSSATRPPPTPSPRSSPGRPGTSRRSEPV